MLDKYSGRIVRNLVLWGSIILNLGILGVYKYFNFFSAGFAAMMRVVGWEVDNVTLDLILPVGISFYTFQALSYVIDVKRRDLNPTKDVVAFMAFISFFPQLVAGPIERATNLLPQFLRNREFDYSRAVEGMRLILWGLFKKMVIADNAAPIVNTVFADYSSVGTANLWIGAFLFTIQIYCDFSGYSDIAVGVARLFGVSLMRNFKLPYFSRDINEFWKKWHISLTSWFRDYVYIPLGGNRKGKVKQIRNTMIVFLTSGLWHGANSTFIVWGAYHGLLYLPSIVRGRKSREKGESQRGLVSKIVLPTLLMGTTFILVMIGWIIFRAQTIHEALGYISSMFDFSSFVHSGPIDEASGGTGLLGKRAVGWSVIMLIAEWLGRHSDSPVDLLSHGIGRYRAVRWSLYTMLFLTTIIFAGSSEQFIYFQF